MILIIINARIWSKPFGVFWPSPPKELTMEDVINQEKEKSGGGLIVLDA
jgi:hypothetical protein